MKYPTLWSFSERFLLFFKAYFFSMRAIYAGLVQTRKLSNYVKRKQDVNLEKFKAGVMECPILWSFLVVIKQNARKGR